MIRVAPPEHYPWLAERADLEITPRLRAIESIDPSGRILGMVGYDGWTDTAACMHIALGFPGAFRALIRPAFEWLFLDDPRGAGKQVAVCQVLSTNARSLELVRHVGFREVFRGQGWWAPGVDLCWFEMRRDDCRWIGA